jgi:hypothetical protein
MHALAGRGLLRAILFLLLTVLGLSPSLPTVWAAGEFDAKFQGVSVQPGKTISAMVPLSPEEKSYAAIGGNRVPASAMAVLAVPQDFDPRRSWPVLVVFSTSDFQRENRGDIPFYVTEALIENWLVLTGDGPERPQEDSTGWRAAMTLAALDALHRSFPGSNKWPVACAGISGGAKRACLLAPLLALKGNRIAGLYLAGVNEDLLGEGYRKIHPGREFLSTKIFITSGQSDRIATSEQTEHVRRSIRSDGFQQVRLETFPEGHNVKRPLTREALRWFHSTSAKSVPVGRLAAEDLHLRMEAKEVGFGPQKRIVFSFKDSSLNAGPIAAHVYFIAKAPDGGARFIYAHSDLSVNLRSASEANASVDYQQLKSDPNRRAPVGFVLAGLGEMEGWIATAQTNGKTFRIRASGPALLDVAQGKSQDSLDAMIADYQRRAAEPAPHR